VSESAVSTPSPHAHAGSNRWGYAYSAGLVLASGGGRLLPEGTKGPLLAGIPYEFLLFALTLGGVALFHRLTLLVAVSGLVSIATLKVGFAGLDLAHHLQHEWVVLANLACLLLGFALLADHFERSHVPELLPRWLPGGWAGGFVLLALVFALSAFLDNIAAAMIGATIAKVVFAGRVHVGYLAGIVAASNAGGAGSVVGDTTTTMMWIGGVSPLGVLPAFVAAIPALLVLGVIAARQQDAHHPIQADPAHGVSVDGGRLLVVAMVLAAAIGVNVTVNVAFVEHADRFPFIGVAIATALVLTAPIRRPTWSLLRGAFVGSCFLLALVLCASLMPVEELPSPSWRSALGLGFLSAVFDNIPLTKLAIDQGGYDWGVLAYAVGFGGSMVWFGSSAGVAVSNTFPEAKSVATWLRHGWHVIVAYIVGFAVLLGTLGWQPTPKRGDAIAPHPAHSGSSVPEK